MQRKINLALVFLLFFCMINCFSSCDSSGSAQSEAEYKLELQKAADLMLKGAADAEEAGNKIHDVWYNTIFKIKDTKTDFYTHTAGTWNDDFNISLQKLFKMDTFAAKLDGIKGNQDEVFNQMKKISTPPKGCEDAFQATKDLYDAYYKFTNLVISPSGNLSSYTSSFNEADDEVLRCYNNLKLYL